MESEFDGDSHAGIRAAPLFELLSVSVHSLSNEVADGRPLRIYGVIAVVKDAEHDDIIELYNRFRDDPEEVWLGDKLSLKGCPITHPAKPLRVGVYLRDAVRGVQMASGIFTVEYKTQQDYDVRKTVTVDGEFGCGTICYNSYFSAMVGVVEVQTTKLEDDGNDYIGVYGSISTRVGGGYSQRMARDDCFLFKRHPPNAFNLLSSRMIDLSRSYVAAPAGSFLWIMVDLRDDTNCIIAKSKLKIRVDEHFRNYQAMVEDGFHTQLTVHWMHPYELSYREINKVKELLIEQPESSVVQSDGVEQSEDGEQECLEKRLSTICRLRGLPEPLRGTPLVEVFSVFVDCINRKCVGINGVVELRDCLGTYSIFREDHNDHDVLREPRKMLPKRSSTKLSLSRGVISRCIKFEEFSFTSKLKDKKNRLVSNGYVEWGDDAKDYMSWYDKPICSVFKGDFGFSTVHYSIFSEAVEAKFIVGLSPINSSDFSSKVWGSITGRYKNFDYSTYYAQEFYQSTIFEEHAEKPISLIGRSEVPLSKTAVPVPLRSSLMVSVDLVVVDGLTLGRKGVVQGVREFEPFLKASERISGDGFEVILWCTWNLVRDV